LSLIAVPTPSLILCLVLAAVSAAPLPPGWWIVEAAGGKGAGTPGSAWRFRAPSNQLGDAGDAAHEAILAVDAERQHVRRSELSCRPLGERVWQCDRALKAGKQYLHLLLRADGQLVGTEGREGETPSGQMTARRATSAEAAQLEAVATREAAENQLACGRARRCYAVACPAFGQPDDPCIFEQHSMSHDAVSCTEMVPMLASVLRQLGKTVPPECVEVPGKER
jgi:hypothetical protein